MSLIATQVHSILNEMFPANPFRRVFEEHFILYKKQKLYFDFFIPETNLLVECQGQQHFEFVRHFHGDKANFTKQKLRDNLKIAYVQENGLYLVRFNYNEDITKDLIYDKINKAYSNDLNYCL